MSGIAGIYHRDGRPVEHSAIDRMVETLAHRGPDGSGVWVDGPVALGHRMFHDTPESLHEQQPCVDKDRQLVLVADARIDNRDDLIRHFDLTAEEPLFISDSRLILLSYAKWGEECVKHLLGDFAFALWDGRQRLFFCARDYIGVKPCYYAHENGRFVCASELQGLLGMDPCLRRLNEEMIASYLACDSYASDKEFTFYQGCYRLPPAHTMVVNAHGIRKQCYWVPDTDKELRLKSDSEYAEAFKDVFSESVKCRLRSAFPIGSMLSGGMDSSSVTCMARDLLKKDSEQILKTFSAVYDHLDRVNERHYQDTVINTGGVESFRVDMSKVGPLQAYLDGQPQFEFPFLGWAYYIHKSLHGLINSHGVRIVLEGFGGDDVVCHGISHLAHLLRGLRLISFWRSSFAYSRRYNKPASRVVWRLGVRPNIPPSVFSIYRVLRGGSFRKEQHELNDYPIDPLLLKRTHVRERAVEPQPEKRPLSLRHEHAVAFTSGRAAHSLELLDRWCSEYPLVTRHPFYDQRLVELSLSLPPEQKLSDGWTRIVLRRAMKGILPVENQWRPDKSNNTPHLNFMMKGQEKPLLLQTLDHLAPVLEGYVDLRHLRDICDGYLSKQGNGNVHLAIWPAITLGHFLSTYHFSRVKGGNLEGINQREETMCALPNQCVDRQLSARDTIHTGGT